LVGGKKKGEEGVRGERKVERKIKGSTGKIEKVPKIERKVPKNWIKIPKIQRKVPKIKASTENQSKT